MPTTFTAYSMREALAWVGDRAADGDTLVVANQHQRLSAESLAVSLGLEIVVKVDPEAVLKGFTTRA